jgi:radical SAM family uncharacterized protein/radical SAM-linked protein
LSFDAYTMSPDTIQEMLSLVEQPSRYLGTEVNRIRKDPLAVNIRVALAFPDLYEIGMSHFGIQILYHLINRRGDALAERVFAPADDMAGLLVKHNRPLFSLESRTPLAAFDLIGFSLLYEMNYTNVLHMLRLGGIPFTSAERDHRHPLVIAGGPCTCNPEPIAEIFDAVIIGDGEAVVDQLLETAIGWREETAPRKSSLFQNWSQIQGVYIPSFHTVGQTRSKSPPPPVRRVVAPELGSATTPLKPLIPFGKPIHDRLRIEIARGCTRGCRFCQAGMIYRPVRERPMASVLDITAASLAATGYEDLSLLSLSTGDYACIAPLMQQLIERYRSQKVAISLPSLRAGTLTPALMQQVRSIRKTGFTIAPEAGSQRLRNVINKNITDDDIARTVTDAVALGWKVIKLYFMIGLPTETDRDLDAICDLVKALQVQVKSLNKGRRATTLNVSFSTFIPKPHTPFQWEPQIQLAESTHKIHALRQKLSGPNVKVKWQNPHISFLEGLWARGGRNLTPLLETAYQKGCRFDGWSDHFRFDRWREAIQESGIDVEAAVYGQRSLDANLPWDHIDIGVTKDFLWQERQRAFQGKRTGDCRTGECNACGVCDFDRIQPLSHGPATPEGRPEPAADVPGEYVEKRVRFEKTGNGRFLSHIELVNAITRALRRADVPLRYTEGFHPTPKMAFEDALPIGLESYCEICYLWVGKGLGPEQIITGVNRQLPEGIRFLDCQPAPSRRQRANNCGYRYQIRAPGNGFDPQIVSAFLNSRSLVVTRRRKKGPTSVDLRPMVTEMTATEDNTLILHLVPHQERKTRPAEILQAVFKMPTEAIAAARCHKMICETEC